jgi:catechol-2,3-dioxygenase
MTLQTTQSIGLQVPDVERAAEFYQKSFNLEVVRADQDCVEFRVGDYHLFLNRGKNQGPILEPCGPHAGLAKVS